jgi:simple sugar transport system permease protein
VFNLLAVGVASAVYRKALGNAAVPESIGMFQPLHLPFLSHLTVIGPELFGQTILFYLTIALAFAAHFVLFRTNFGLALRASGENPAAANSAGISVYRMR